MFKQLYNTNERFGVQLLDIFWKVFYITSLSLICIDFCKDLMSGYIIDPIIIGLFRFSLILFVRIIYEMFDRYLERTDDKIDEITKAIWMIYNQLKRN